MKDLISIIVPVYNVAEYLPRCLDSLINQTYKKIEIILINDGSKDESLMIAQDYASRDKRIIVIDKKNTGQADSRRVGFGQSKGKYIAFVDSDDYVEPTYIDYLYSLIIEEKADIATCDYCYNDNINNRNEQKKIFTDREILVDYYNNTNIKTCVWNKLFKRKNLDESDFGDKHINNGEDVIFTIKELLKIKKIVCGNLQKYHYNTLNQSATRSQLNIKKINDSIYAHIKQIEMISEKYRDDKIYNYSVDKLFNVLVELYNQSLKDYSYTKEVYLQIKELNAKYNYLSISKNNKLKSKIKFILKRRLIYNYLYIIKCHNKYSLIYLLLSFIMALLVLFPITYKVIDKVIKTNKLSEINSIINNRIINNNSILFLNKSNSSFERGYIKKKNGFLEILAYDDGYCITKLHKNKSIDIFTSSKQNCGLDKSPQIYNFSGSKISISDLKSSYVNNYAIYGSFVEEKYRISSDVIVGPTINSDMDIYIYNNDNTQYAIHYDFDKYGGLYRLDDAYDYLSYEGGTIHKNIGTIALSNIKSIDLANLINNDTPVYIIRLKNSDKEYIIELNKSKLKKLNSIISTHPEYTLYYKLAEEKVYDINTPTLNVNNAYEIDLKTKNKNSLFISAYSMDE